MRKTFILVMALILTTSICGSSFAMTSPVKTFKINTVSALKSEINKSYENGVMTDGEKEDIIRNTDTDILKEFINEKGKVAKKAFEELNGEDIVLQPNSLGIMSYEKTVDLGDNCSIKIEMTEGEDESVVAKLENFFFDPVYAVSQSGGDSLWKAYGDRYFTATASVCYVLATGSYILENHYNLSASGIYERYGTEGSRHSGIMVISPNSPTITVSTATQTGTYVRMQCTYNTIYTIPTPIALEWGGTHIMKTSVKYVALDTVNQEVHVTQDWTFTNM